ncbi:hypothetical protein ACFYYB_10585 [Streptomyces sp. NPDC002886]|uniref:hypothetical protein n=1 Tax=Streptomyces sp. NPDC002886 TaxID=3364667 RepID=UPI00369771F8
MERHELMRLLAGDDAASKAALAALVGGAEYSVREDWIMPSDVHAQVLTSKLRYMRWRGMETLGVERAVQTLGEQTQSILSGLVKASDGSWNFMFFLTEDGGALVACIGMRRPDKRPSRESGQRGQTSP